MSADKNLYRVWPDGWVQDASEEPYSWRSDDLLVIAALPELLGAADNALGVLIASVIPAGGAAFQDLFAGWRSRGEPVCEDWPMGLALDAYCVADAMLKAREGGAT